MQKIITTFQEVFAQLQVAVDPLQLEELVITVHRAMTAPGRNYHRIEHAFSLVEAGCPLHTLAAFFHDIVYFQVDMEIPPEISPLIESYLDEIDAEAGTVTITGAPAATDRPFALALAVFDVKPGQTLNVVTYLNEFLSALVMLRKLAGLLSERDLLHVLVCIEATIPFRPVAADGSTHFGQLERRLIRINRDYRLNLRQADIEALVRSAVLLANKDLQGFAAADASEFLSLTWQLLPETNVDLRIREGYSISAYRYALQKMEEFVGGLDAGRVFHQYRGTPDAGELQRLNQLARRNLQAGGDYLAIKLLAIVIIEALAAETGGDVPLALFMGDIVEDGQSAQRFEDYLPDCDDGAWVDFSSTLGGVLKSGRARASDFDSQDAPLSLFLYRRLSPAQITGYLAQARRMIDHEISAADFLAAFDKAVLSDIAAACAEMVPTRRERLLSYTL